MGVCLVSVCLVGAGLASPVQAQTGRTYRADGVAAVVGESSGQRVIVLRSDVDLRARMRLAGRVGDGPLPLGPLPQQLLAATLEELIGEALIALEADRIQIAAPTPRDVARERARLATLSGGRTRLGELLEALGANQQEIEVAAERRATVSVFLVANLDGSMPSDAEVEHVYQTGEHPFSDRPLDDIREPLRAYVMQRKLQDAVERWVTSLRSRVPVRVHEDFARGATAP